MLILVGPSGGGKSTLIGRLRKEFPGCFGYSVSHTTRGIRPGEVNGSSYHFVQPSEFLALIDSGEFIEHAIVHDTMYGTSTASVRSVLDRDQVCTMDLDIVGAQNLRKHPTLMPFVIFVQPPTLEECEKRLRNRGTETEERIEKRMCSAVKEVAWADAHRDFFDCMFINDDLEECYEEFREKVMSGCFAQPEDHSR